MPARERVLRTGALLYAGALLAGVAIDTPLGGNLVRLAAVFGGPLAIGALWERRRQFAIAVLAIPLLYWQWLAPVRSVIRGAGDPSSELSYHAPLIAELDRRSRAEGPFRTEIPFTPTTGRRVTSRRAIRSRAAGSASSTSSSTASSTTTGRCRDRACAAGWTARGALRRAARRGARPGRPRGGRARARGARTGAARGLEGGDWRLFRVAGDEPLVSAPARVTQLGVDELTLRTPRPATVDLRVRFTPYLALVRGRGCVSEAPGGWTRVRLDAAGDSSSESASHRAGSAPPRRAARPSRERSLGCLA